MPQKPSDPETQRKENWKAFQGWLSKHGKALAPETGLGVVYAGIRGAGETTPSGIYLNGAMKPDLMPMWKWIKGWNDMVRSVTGKTRFDTLEDVLQRMTDTPRVFQPEGRFAGSALLYRTMYDCATELSDAKKALLPKAEAAKVWKLLSATYVGNVRGDLAILKGVMENFRRIDETKILISTELPALLRNPDLSKEAQEELRKLAAAYADVFKRYAKVRDEVRTLAKALAARG